MYKVFDTLQEYNQFTNDGANLTAGVIYYIKEDGSTHFQTNNINGEEMVYDMIDGIPEGYIKPTGNISITENGENINVNEYATASVNVPIPEGYIVPSGNKEITQNGENIDIAQYATASVNVVPNLTTQNITENGTYQPSGNYDGFSSVTVNVDAPAKDYIVEGAVYDPTATYSGAFTGNTYIKSITIPEGFTSIEYGILTHIESLENLTIPNTVTSIGNSIFHRSFTIDTLTIPDSVTTIGYKMLDNGDGDKLGGVKNIVIGSGLSEVKQYEYGNYEGFFGNGSTRRCETIKVSPNNTTYDSRDNCNAIIETATNTLLVGCNGTVIPSSVTAIKEYAFNHCFNLPSIIIPEGVTNIGNYTFSNCKSMTSVTIPNSVTSIGASSFSRCKGLTTVTIPNSVESIGEYAFYICSSLTNVNIGSGVTSIGAYAFSDVKNANITILATTPPTLGSNGFGYTFNNCQIYVPAESVDAYKAATNWSTYANQIQAIPTE